MKTSREMKVRIGVMLLYERARAPRHFLFGKGLIYEEIVNFYRNM